MKISNETPLFPLRKGRHSRQAHVDLPEGTFEEEHARQGFFGKTTHLYRLHPPTAWTRIEGPLTPHSYDLNNIFPVDPAVEGDALLQQARAGALLEPCSLQGDRSRRSASCTTAMSRRTTPRNPWIFLPQCRWR